MQLLNRFVQQQDNEADSTFINDSAISRTIIITTIVVILICTVYIAYTTLSLNGIELPYLVFLLLFVIGLPVFLTYGVYSIYAHFYISDADEISTAYRAQRQQHVSLRHYTLEMSILVLMMVVIATGFIWRDSEGSHHWGERLDASHAFVMGRGSLPLYISSGSLRQTNDEGQTRTIPNEEGYFIPTGMFWMAYIGASIVIMNTIFQRFVVRHLVPRTYFNAALRFFTSMVAAALIFLAVSAWPGITEAQMSDLTMSPEPGALLLLLAFFAGMFPQTIIQWIVYRVRNVLRLRHDNEIAITEIIGISDEMAVFLHDEGIWSLVDLARRDPDRLAARIHIDNDVVREWQCQAQLLLELGSPELIDKFHKLGINDFDDLAALSLPDDQTLTVDDFNPTETDKISIVTLRVLAAKAAAIRGERDGNPLLPATPDLPPTPDPAPVVDPVPDSVG